MTQKKYPELPVMLVDDEREWLRNLSLALQRNLRITHFMTCQDSREVMPLLAKQHVSLAILDMTMPHVNGHQLLLQIKETHPETPVIILTGRNEIDLAVKCMKDGALDYFIKTEETERLFAAIKRVMEMQNIQGMNQRLKEKILGNAPTKKDLFKDIITESPKMQAIFRYIEAISISDEPVLLTGESGVGKELLAKAVHLASNPGGPWVTVNAAGLDDNAFTDSLFGHVKGAYTGADHARAGFVEKAADGTLFLDEIGDLEPASQVKLLRFLQEGEYYPLGSDQLKKAKARLVFATNLDLRKKIESGKFRRDLYYRLQTHQVEIPPLRERPEDIPLLFEHYLKDAAKTMGKEVPKVGVEVFRFLSGQSFFGNVRELRSLAIDAMARHSVGDLTMDCFNHMKIEDATESFRSSVQNSPAKEDSLPTIKKAIHDLILAALEQTGGNRTAAARILGISQPALSKRLKNIDNEI